MEFLRRYLGRARPAYDKLNYLGYSYGTWLGAWYADIYPPHRPVHPGLQHELDSVDVCQPADRLVLLQRRRDMMFYPWVARHNETTFGKTSA